MSALMDFIREARALAKAKRDERKAKADKFAAALAFNRIWAYRPYPKPTRWMCPECNATHERLAKISVFTGLQYPACCVHPEGHRLYDWCATKGATP